MTIQDKAKKFNKIPTPIDLDNEKEVCKICGGEGIVPKDVWNPDVHAYEPTGKEPCACME